ncbi:MAG: DUF805 domain-containing protein [Verrucomicrobiales bacterium]|nr:DUF805 domain-containing protein [Verrucomicrobiales bacterium]
MDFTSAIKSGFSNYANFSGRASRSEFWYWTLFAFILGYGLGFVDGILGVYIVDPYFVDPEMPEFGEVGGIGLFGGLASAVLLIPGLAITWRRLHDIDKSGAWWFILFTCIGAIFLIIWHATKGTVGPNRFGPDPLGSGQALRDPPAPGDGPSLEA